tara:strand:+ start:2297 stop:2479 length:183 start_codon:yes stop_codon:yes gene_type:complete
MIVEQNKSNGSWEISDVIKNHLVRRTYYFYTKAQAMKLFKEEVKNVDNPKAFDRTSRYCI